MSNRSTIDIRRHVTPTAAIALRILLVVAPFASVAEAQFNGGLFAAVDGEHSADAADEVAETPGIRTMRSRLVRVDAEQLEAAREAREVNATLALNLFDEVLLSAVVERAAPTASGIGYALSGRINLAILSGRTVDGDFGAMTLLVYDEDEGTMVTGTVNASIGTFTIRPIGDGVHSIREVDTSGLPQFECNERSGMDDHHAYDWQCRDAGYLIFRTGRYCQRQRRFSNPNLDLSGDALGVSGTADSQEVTGPSDAVRTLNLTRHNRRQTS